MIALVAGDVASRAEDAVVIETASGVGYRLGISATTLESVPPVGGSVSLFAHLVVREDALTLYGFSTEHERDLFLALIGVQSVGPKIALAILSGGRPSDLVAAIAAGDTQRLVAVPGVGKRTADRIVVELRERLALEALATAGGAEGDPAGEIIASRADDPRQIAREGLVGLGFAIDEAERLLSSASGETPEALLAQALKAARA